MGLEFWPMCVNQMVHGFIVESEVLVGNVEHACLTTMVDTITSDHNVDVTTMMADSAYPTGENLTAMEDRNIE